MRKSLAITLLAPFLLWSGQPASLRVDIDVAQFRYDKDANYLELYYGFTEEQLTYADEDGRFEGALILHASFINPADESTLLDRVWRIPHAVADTVGQLNRNTVMGVIGLAVPGGDYSLKVECFDERNDSRKSEVSRPFSVKLFGRDRIELSEIELCSSSPEPSSNRESIFYKNTLEVVPNPGSVYGPAAPFVHFYVEAYNLLGSSDAGGYHTVASVIDSDGREVARREQTKQRLNESSVEVGSVNVSSLSPGRYSLRFTVIDSVADLAVSSVKQFIMTGEHPLLASEYGRMSEEELNSEIEMIQYITREGKRYDAEDFPSVESKRLFLSDFWKKRDPNLPTAVNELREEFFRRVDYANRVFQVGNKAGWKTDRGRVYILYGPPDENERHDSEMGTKPYEIWYYHEIQGGVLFVFADLFGFRDYLLLHSTHRNELRDDNWEIQVRE